MNWLTPLDQAIAARDATTSAARQVPAPEPKPLPPIRARSAPAAPHRAAFVRMLPGGQQVKRCAGCQEDHDVAAFPKGTGPGDLHRYCRAYQKTWRENRKVRGDASKVKR